MKIYFDMDGVLADFDGGVQELCGMPALPNYGSRSSEEDRLMWEEIRKVDHFYGKLRPLPGAREMFQALREKYECEILTGVPKPERGIHQAGQDKIDWVAKYLGTDIPVHIVFRREKIQYCTGKDTVLIDDLAETIRVWKEQGGTGILHTDPESTLKELKEMGIL